MLINRKRLASFLKEKRQERQENQRGFARFLGISQQEVCRLEGGERSAKMYKPRRPETRLVKRVIPILIDRLQLSEEELAKQIGGMESSEILEAAKIILPLFQALVPESVLCSLIPEDINFLLESSNVLGVGMTPELAKALVAARRPSK